MRADDRSGVGDTEDIAICVGSAERAVALPAAAAAMGGAAVRDRWLGRLFWTALA